MHHATEFDLTLFQAINGYAGVSWTLDRIVRIFGISNLVKQGPFVASFAVLWVCVTSDQLRRHADLCFVLIAVSLSLVANRVVSIIFPFRPRPVLQTNLGVHQATVEPIFGEGTIQFESFSSFPSDHAALYFALIAGFWFISKRLAVFMAIWSVACLLPRVFLGWHFPSDILGGAVIGVAVTVVARRGAFLHFLRTCVGYLEKHFFALFNAAVFLFVFQMGILFDDLRHLAKLVFKWAMLVAT